MHATQKGAELSICSRMTNVETEMVIRSSDDTSSEGASGDENKER